MRQDKSETPSDETCPVSPPGGRVNLCCKRFAFYYATILLGICIFAGPLRDLMVMAHRSELYSFIPLMIATCAYLVIQSRKRIFEAPAYSPGWGALVIVCCIAAGTAGLKNSVRLGPDNYLTVMTLSFWFFLIGTFLIFFGPGALLTAMFPMALLLFMIPWPDLILDKVVGFLQSASYTMTGWIFNVLGFFPLEKGFEFKFPELSIEVAPQCSGIRSSIVLVILSLIAGNFMLRSKLNRVLLVIVSVPVAIFKNGVRIAGLTLSAIYLDSRILSSEFHKKGGLPVFILAIGLLFTIVVIMRKLERKKHQVQQQTHVGGVPGASEQSPQ